MKIKTWKAESEIYVNLDASRMKENHEFKETISMAENFCVDVKIINFMKNPIGNHEFFNSEEHTVSLNFRSGNEPFFRMDDAHDYLHYDFESGGRVIKEPIQMSNSFTIAEMVSFTFERAKEIVKWKYPNLEMNESDGFIGSC